MKTRLTVYEFQQRSMLVLLAWAAGSLAAGLFWVFQRDPFVRGVGSQFAGWGAIDGLIGLFALSGARRKARSWQNGRITWDEHDRETGRFEKIVWVNAGLDVGYGLGGYSLYRRSPDQPTRQGMGVGILIQGAFLLVWDVLLALLLRQYVAVGADRPQPGKLVG